MFTTPFATRVRLGALAGILLAATRLSAATVLVPVAARVHGQNDAYWAVELRVMNRTDAVRTFSIQDWIGTDGWKPATYTVPAHTTMSLGGADIFNAPLPLSGAAGLAIIDADPEVLAQSAVLAGIWRPGGVTFSCPSFDGGGSLSDCGGLAGAGPLIDSLAFVPPAHALFIPWLHTDEARRTNLVIINPDDAPAHVSVAIVSQDGLTMHTEQYVFSPRSYNQLSDVFARPPWSEIRTANLRIPFGGAAAAATITSDTRLVGMAYVISNDNNSLTISLPR